MDWLAENSPLNGDATSGHIEPVSDWANAMPWISTSLLVCVCVLVCVQMMSGFICSGWEEVFSSSVVNFLKHIFCSFPVFIRMSKLVACSHLIEPK